MLASLSIRAKIIAVVSVLLVALSGMGALAIRQMSAINGNATEITNNWLPSVRTIGDLQMGVIRYRVLLRDFLLTSNAEKKAAVEKRMEAQDENNQRIYKIYESKISSPQEREQYEEFRKIWSDYTAAAIEILAASRSGQSAKIDEIFTTRNGPLGYKADEVLAKNLNLNGQGAVAAGQAASDHYDLAFKTVLAIVGISLLIGAGLGIVLVLDVSRGIKSIVTPMQALSVGDLTTIVPYQGETTEIGSMADALQVFKQALIDKKAADEAAAVDAEEKIQRGERVNTITRDFEAMIGEIVNTVSSASTELEASAGTLTATAERSQGLTTAVAVASEEASTNVQSVASATEEMASSVNEISRQVQESASIASQAVEQARKTNDRVAELAQAASRIGDVVELINTIAGQTNLLALNATIEAARAGEAGRGFAVVASEVKALAEQTAKATGEISMQISGIQAATKESVGAIKEIGDTIGRMSEISSTIASAVEEQGAATQEISRNVQQAARGTMQVSSNITDVQRGASETGSASSQVLSAAQSLSSESNRLKLEVGKFLSSVRAA